MYSYYVFGMVCFPSGSLYALLHVILGGLTITWPCFSTTGMVICPYTHVRLVKVPLFPGYHDWSTHGQLESCWERDGCWLLLQYDWCPYRKRLGQRERETPVTCMQRDDCEHMARRRPSASKGETLRLKTNPPAPCPRTSSLQDCEQINSCSLSSLSCAIFLQQS